MHQQTPPASLPPLSLSAFVVELVLIVAAAIFAALVYADFDPQKRLGGVEAEYLTRTAFSVAPLLHEKGYIPLWEPYLEFGDPMLDNPVSFAFNPIAMWPSIALGPQNGIKVSIILTAIVAGLGGWALARVIGLGALARLLLALLCIGKGNMHSFLSQGHISFFLSQAYFPWIFAGVMGILLGYRRWPVILTAISFAMVFWTGIPWYPPALVITIGLLTLAYVVTFYKGPDPESVWHIQIEWGKLGLVVLSMLFTLGLVANIMVPLWNKRGYIGETTIFSDFRANLVVVLGQYFNDFKGGFNSEHFPPGQAFAYYNYISPLWYALLIVGLLLAVAAFRRQFPAFPKRLMIGALAIFIFCTLWGAGWNPIIDLSYKIIPLATQFRYVQRVFGLPSLWLAVIGAVAVDILWLHLVRKPVWAEVKRLTAVVPVGALRLVTAIVLVVTSGVAAFQVIGTWHVSWGSFFVRTENEWEDYCITWLRKQYPDRELSVWTLDYKNIYTYLRNRVRHGWVASDFYHPSALPSTVYVGSLVPIRDAPPARLPEFAIGGIHYDEAWMQRNDYRPIPESANPFDNNRPCMYRREGAFSYAFAVTRDDLNTHPDALTAALTTPITAFARDYDQIAVFAQGRTDADVVVTVQELAYPGWAVWLDGKPAQLESVGGQIGVLLPRSAEQHTIWFRYLPSRFFQGEIITLIAIILCGAYLLGGDRFVTQERFKKMGTGLLDTWQVREPS